MNEKAVSPVIGVILMLFFVVILTAIITVFVLEMWGTEDCEEKVVIINGTEKIGSDLLITTTDNETYTCPWFIAPARGFSCGEKYEIAYTSENSEIRSWSRCYPNRCSCKCTCEPDPCCHERCCCP